MSFTEGSLIQRTQENLSKIGRRLIEFENEIKQHGSLGLYDIHKYAENVIRDLLNIIYDYKFVNLNLTRSNYPAIDLGDTERKTCVQVTFDKSPTELSKLEVRFFENELDKKYDTFQLFLLNSNVEKSKKIKAFSKLKVTESQIFDFTTILKALNDLGQQGHSKIDAVLNLLDDHHIKTEYLNSVLASYREVAKQRMDAPAQFYIEPYLAEETILRNEEVDEWDDNLKRNRSRREYSKVNLSSTLEKERQFIVTGNPGTGKSELLKHIFHSLIDTNPLKSTQSLVPILVTLSNSDKPQKIENLIFEELDKFLSITLFKGNDAILKELLRLLLKSGDLCLLLDGFDELDTNNIKAWNEHIRIFQKNHFNSRIIISVRKNRIRGDIALPVSKLYEILPFDEQQLEKYARHLFEANGKIDEERLKKTLAALKESRINYLSPVLVIKMLIETSIEDIETQIENPRAALIYKEYFTHIILKKLKDKGIDRPEHRLEKLCSQLVSVSFKILSEIACKNIFGKSSLKNQTGLKKLENILNRIENKIHRVSFIKGLNFFSDELQIIKFDSVGNLKFNHFTFQEFFFAYWLKDRILKRFSDEFRWTQSAYTNPKHHQTFLFLGGSLSKFQAESFIRRFLRWPLSLRLAQAKLGERVTASKALFVGELASECMLSKRSKNKIVKRVKRHIKSSEPLIFLKSVQTLSRLAPNSIEIFDQIFSAATREIHWQKREGLIIYSLASCKNLPTVLTKIRELLYHKDSYMRGTALEFFSRAELFDDDISKRAEELNFEENSLNSSDAHRYFNMQAIKYPEKSAGFIRKVVDEGIKKSTAKYKVTFENVMPYFAAKVLNISEFDDPENEERILYILSQNFADKVIKSNLIHGFSKLNIRNQIIADRIAEIVLEDEEIAFAGFMYFRDLKIMRPEIIQKAILYLESENDNTRARAMNYLAEMSYSGKVDFNGNSIPLAIKIKETILAQKEFSANLFYTYALEYLGNVKYSDPKLTEFLFNRITEKRETTIVGEEDNILKYFVASNHFSENFLIVISNHQCITLSRPAKMGSFISDDYFEHIEKYAPIDKLSEIKSEIYNVMMHNLIQTLKARKIIKKNPNHDLPVDEIASKFFRSGMALQKIALLISEQKIATKIANGL